MVTQNPHQQLELFGEAPPPSPSSTETSVSGKPVLSPEAPRLRQAEVTIHGSVKPRCATSAKHRLRAHRKRLRGAGLSRIETTVDATTLRVLKAVALAQNTGSASRMAGEVLKQWAARQRISED